MKKIIIAVLFFTALSTSFANNFVKIHGVILSQKDSTPISNVNIGITGKPLGTISNESGEFLFYIPMVLINDSIYFSSLGFAKHTTLIKTLNSKSSVILLKPQNYFLNEVIISSVKLTGDEIIIRSKKHLERKLSNSQSLYEAYYQEYIKQNNKSTRALDAAVEIYQKRSKDPFQVKVKQIRKKDNLLVDKHYLNANNLKLILEQNEPKKLFQGYKNYQYTVDSIIVYNNTLVYVINATLLNQALSYKRYYIAVNDFSVVRVDKIINNTNGNTIKIPGVGYITLDSVFLSITFFQYREEMYPKIMKYCVTTTRLDEKNGNHQTTYRRAELLTVNVKKENIKEIPEKERMNDHIEMFKQSFSYDPVFWKNYNIIPENP